jgi:nitrite reductase/ring-hydroxylating ferredoxin subunit
MDGEARQCFMRDEWRSMQRRVVAHLEGDKSTDLASAVTSLDARVYTDPARLDAERTHVFQGQPLLAGFSGDLPEPGARLLFDAAGPPILIVRGRDGVLSAFLNLCTHRGSRIVNDCSPSRRLVCPHHGWSFDLAGELVSTPLPQAFDEMERKERSLVRVPVAEWNGLVFVRARAGDDVLDVEEWLGGLAPLFTALDLAGLVPVKTSTLGVRANWKMALDTFCETYHVPALHRDTLSVNLIPYVTLFDHYERHHRYAGPGLDFEPLVGQPESEWPELHYQAVHYLFPNTIVTYTNAFDGKTPVVSLFRLFPGASAGEAITLAAIYRRKEAGDVSDEKIEELHDFVLKVVEDEDYRVASESWQSISHAPPGFRCVFGRAEPLLQRYHQDIAQVIGMALPD